MTVRPFCKTKREAVPTCSCRVTAAAAGTFTGSAAGALVPGVGTRGRVLPLCAAAVPASEVMTKVKMDTQARNDFNWRTGLLLL